MNSTVGKLWHAAQNMGSGFIDRVPALVLAIAVFFLFYLLSRLLARVITKTILRRRANVALVFARLVAGATIMLGLLVSISVVAPSFRASDLIKILGIGGVAIGFAFQNILQNFLAGLLLLWSEPFRVGDEIKVDAFEGKVKEIQTRATIIVTYDEREVVIPNADLFTKSVIVNTAEGMRRWQYDFDVKKTGDLDGLKKAIVDAVRGVSGVLGDPEPEALVAEVTADAFKIRVLWSTNDSHQHEMMGSYDQVLTAVADAIDKFQSAPNAQRAA
ncbi:MAG TPA: mechanosensitive ion channel domain-containing protein [Terracidiphilus sp.]|nr:mechanosensitive ion channel domain-containing protein [Terracidiphilus sp.]